MPMPAPTTPSSHDGPAACPVRPGDACALCHPGAHGPEDCGLVYLVMSDPDLREQLIAAWAEQEAAHRAAAPEV
jgi:hypothetical protein